MPNSDPDRKHREFYLEAIRQTVSNIGQFFGYQSAMKNARKSPLRVDAEGDIQDYYGEGKLALRILVEKFEDEIGEEVAQERLKSGMRKSFEPDKWHLLPEDIRPSDEEDEKPGLLERIF